MIGACRLLRPRYTIRVISSPRDNTRCAVFRSGAREASFPVEELIAPAVECLSYEALSEWHFGDIGSCKTNMAEAIALAKELNDMAALGLALYWAGFSPILRVIPLKWNAWHRI